LRNHDDPTGGYQQKNAPRSAKQRGASQGADSPLSLLSVLSAALVLPVALLATLLTLVALLATLLALTLLALTLLALTLLTRLSATAFATLTAVAVTLVALPLLLALVTLTLVTLTLVTLTLVALALVALPLTAALILIVLLSHEISFLWASWPKAGSLQGAYAGGYREGIISVADRLRGAARSEVLGVVSPEDQVSLVVPPQHAFVDKALTALAHSVSGTSTFGDRRQRKLDLFGFIQAANRSRYTFYSEPIHDLEPCNRIARLDLGIATSDPPRAAVSEPFADHTDLTSS
jgi:hypothetical protein